MKLLVLDIGNTRIKWGLHTPDGWLQRDTEPQDFSAIQQQLRAQPDGVIASNVRRNLPDDVWRTVWSHLPCHGVQSRTQQCNVHNDYQEPSQLGSDRWAALIGAQGQGAETAIVVNAGTALTIDALHDHRFLGGTIAPGYRMMQRALAEHTALPEPHRTDCCTAFPNNTVDAIACGCLRAMIAGIDTQYQHLAKNTHTTPALWLSGGDSNLLAKFLPDARIEPWLVLEGLYRIAQEVFA